MFNWLGNIFPYSDLHSLNLDWLLSKMKETATQAAQAIADSAKALAQVIEAKTAAQDAQTAAQNAQTAANNAQTAANNAATSAENAVSVAQAAKSAAQTAQSTADAAKSAAQTAQNTANTAQSAAETAQSAAQNAADAVTTINNRFPIKTADIADKAVTTAKIANDSITSVKVMNGSLYLNKFAKSSLFALALPVVAGDGGDKEYHGEPVTYTYGSANSDRVDMIICRLGIDGETLAVSVPGANPSSYPLTYRQRLVRSNGQDLIISITVSNNKVTFNIGNYADSGLDTIHVYFHPMVISTAT